MKAKERSVWLTGKASPRAKQELQALGWMLQEEFFVRKAGGS